MKGPSTKEELTSPILILAPSKIIVSWGGGLWSLGVWQNQWWSLPIRMSTNTRSVLECSKSWNKIHSKLASPETALRVWTPEVLVKIHGGRLAK